MQKNTLQKIYIFICVGILLHTPQITLAQFTPLIEGLAPVPGDMSSYLERLYILAISAAALLAVGKIIFAGIKYVTSGVVTEKQGAKEDIRSALVGLLIILCAVAILRVINPGLTNLPALTPARQIVDWSVVESAPPQTSIPCTEINADDGSTYYDCREARDMCQTSEGHEGEQINNAIICTRTRVDSRGICSLPQGCTKRQCPIIRIAGIFTGCSGWCSSFSNSVYDQHTEVCVYANNENTEGPNETTEYIPCDNIGSLELPSYSCGEAEGRCSGRAIVNESYVSCYTTRNE